MTFMNHSVICYDKQDSLSSVQAVSVGVRCPSTAWLELDGGWSLIVQLGCHLQLQRTNAGGRCWPYSTDWDMMITIHLHRVNGTCRPGGPMKRQQQRPKIRHQLRSDTSFVLTLPYSHTSLI